MPDVVALIPARSGSKGVLDKNIKLLVGKPLIAYSIAAAQLTDVIERVIVSTDSEEYAGIAREYGAEVPFLRPAEISGHSSGDYEWVRHTLDWMQNNEGYLPKYLVHLRPTTPLRDPALITEAIEIFRSNPEATGMRSAHEMANTAYKCFEVDGGYLKSAIVGDFDLDGSNHPRQEYPITYDCNGYVDILRSTFINENPGKIHGDRVVAFITPNVGEVDTPEEFEYLEYFAKKNPQVYSRLFD